MRVIHSRELIPADLGPSIFLAGPTPRSKDVRSWRTKSSAEEKCALDILRKKGVDITVIVPEDRDGTWNEAFNYDAQLDWEHEGLTRATCILFWIPRDLETLPGFTTNDEFGTWKYSGKVVFGAPPKAPKMKYQRYYARKIGIPTAETLEGTIDLALEKLEKGAENEVVRTDESE
jgi:hypothetical protein